ncbi:MAG: hypothetical protein FJY36_01360 [Betaproteobacteria bacterium]|nr:hypothetical protein [Betaproteobacteria bacterium]
MCGSWCLDEGGDRGMAQVLNAVTQHVPEAVQVAVELALQSGWVSAEHVLNVLSRLVDVRVLDHLIVTRSKVLSIAEEGLL